jgi:hypothetical protein
MMDPPHGYPVQASLHGFGVEPRPAEVLVRHLSTVERLRRSGTAAGLGLAVAVLTLPIPIVHFMFPPAALITGLVVGARRLGTREVFQLARATCPFCGREQRLNLAGSRFSLPRDHTCFGCGKPLRLEADRAAA